ncbi:MAG: VacJ family lipoprotein [Phenylobacterium sp.]|nr:VacJ family lipoprotein [Phenylobacterium sp.]
MAFVASCGPRSRSGATAVPGLLAAALLLVGCATVAPGAAGRGSAQAAPRAAGDPFEGLNRRLFGLGGRLDGGLVRPIVNGYRRVTPGPVRRALHNILQNADEPLVFLNDVLQLHPRAAVRTAARFGANTTVGIVGIFDPATPAGLPHHDNGFGSTLGRYGVGPGPYVYMPFLGPTSIRDMVGEGVDFATDPLSFAKYRHARTVAIARTGLDLLDEREQAEKDLQTLDTSADPYATVRSVYLQSREAEIKGPDASFEALPAFPSEGEAAAPPGPMTPPPEPPAAAPAVPAP